MASQSGQWALPAVHIMDTVRPCVVAPVLPRVHRPRRLVTQVIPTTELPVSARPAPQSFPSHTTLPSPATALDSYLNRSFGDHVQRIVGFPPGQAEERGMSNHTVAAVAGNKRARSVPSLALFGNEWESGEPSLECPQGGGAEEVGVEEPVCAPPSVWAVEWSDGTVSCTADLDGLEAEERLRLQHFIHLRPACPAITAATALRAEIAAKAGAPGASAVAIAREQQQRLVVAAQQQCGLTDRAAAVPDSPRQLLESAVAFVQQADRVIYCRILSFGAFEVGLAAPSDLSGTMSEDGDGVRGGGAAAAPTNGVSYGDGAVGGDIQHGEKEDPALFAQLTAIAKLFESIANTSSGVSAAARQELHAVSIAAAFRAAQPRDLRALRHLSIAVGCSGRPHHHRMLPLHRVLLLLEQQLEYMREHYLAPAQARGGFEMCVPRLLRLMQAHLEGHIDALRGSLQRALGVHFIDRVKRMVAFYYASLRSKRGLPLTSDLAEQLKWYSDFPSPADLLAAAQEAHLLPADTTEAALAPAHFWRHLSSSSVGNGPESGAEPFPPHTTSSAVGPVDPLYVTAVAHARQFVEKAGRTMHYQEVMNFLKK